MEAPNFRAPLIFDYSHPGNWCLIFLALVTISCKTSGRESALVFVEDFRKPGMKDEQVIQRAISSANTGATIYFEPGKTYVLHNRILVKRFQTLMGNNATLKRADQSFTFLASVAAATSDHLLIDSIPPDWLVGDQLQVFTDSLGAHSNPFGDYPKLPNMITKIETNKIFLSSVIGSSVDGTIQQWPKGSIVRKVFTMLRGDSLQIKSVPFTVVNMNFDGNRKNNDLNYYWNVNSTIFVKGIGSKIADCRFYDIPNENIVGHGLNVSNCQARNLNGSFVHFSGTDTVREFRQKNSFISGNTIENVCLNATTISGHSEAVFTTSFSGGFATITNNRVYNSQESVIGIISSPAEIADGGKSEFIIQGNLFKDCRQIVHDIHYVKPGARPSTDIYISNNIFSNCGYNDWTTWKGYADCPDIKIGENVLTNQTVWKY